MKAQDVVVVEGEKMYLKIPYQAIPKPSMVWKKGEAELKADDRLTMRCELNCIHLELLKCKHEDAGVYTVTLENSLGSATGTINVKVIGKTAVFFCLKSYFVKKNNNSSNGFHQ